MENIRLILLIVFVSFVAIWLVCTILWLVFDYNKPVDLFLYCLFKKQRNEMNAEKELKKEQLKREHINKNGTEEEKIKYYNELMPDYQMMTDEEVKEKYKQLYFNRITIVEVPMSTYNIDENKFVSGNDLYEVVNSKLQLKPGNRRICVDSYTKLDMKVLRNCKKIAVFRHKTDTYRYKILDNIK